MLAALTLTSSAAHAIGETESDLVIADWGDEFEYRPGNYAALTLGRDNRGNQLFDALLLITAGEHIALDANAGKNEINDAQPTFTTKYLQLGLGSTQSAGLNIHISTRFWGKKQTIETSDLAFELSFLSQDRWRTGVVYETGDVTLFTDPVFSSKLDSVVSDRHAWGINSSHSHDTGVWWISYVKRNYERDLPAIDSRPLLQVIIQNIALDQAYALSSDEYNLGYEWYFQRFDFSIQFSRITSIIDNSDNDYLILGHRYYANETISIQTSLQNSLEENLINLNIGLGVLW